MLYDNSTRKSLSDFLTPDEIKTVGMAQVYYNACNHLPKGIRPKVDSKISAVVKSAEAIGVIEGEGLFGYLAYSSGKTKLKNLIAALKKVGLVELADYMKQCFDLITPVLTETGLKWESAVEKLVEKDKNIFDDIEKQFYAFTTEVKIDDFLENYLCKK